MEASLVRFSLSMAVDNDFLLFMVFISSAFWHELKKEFIQSLSSVGVDFQFFIGAA
jgi:hypothetical protein